MCEISYILNVTGIVGLVRLGRSAGDTVMRKKIQLFSSNLTSFSLHTPLNLPLLSPSTRNVPLIHTSYQRTLPFLNSHFLPSIFTIISQPWRPSSCAAKSTTMWVFSLYLSSPVYLSIGEGIRWDEFVGAEIFLTVSDSRKFSGGCLVYWFWRKSLFHKRKKLMRLDIRYVLDVYSFSNQFHLYMYVSITLSF